MTSNVSVGRWLVVVTLAVLCILSFLVGAALIVSSSGAASSKDVVDQGKHRDCVTTLSTARRSVFDNVDIYKAIQIDQLSTALLNAQAGIRASQADIDAFRANAKKLDDALKEAERLQPGKTLDQLIAHGGMIDGQHFDPCPT